MKRSYYNTFDSIAYTATETVTDILPSQQCKRRRLCNTISTPSPILFQHQQQYQPQQQLPQQQQQMDMEDDDCIMQDNHHQRTTSSSSWDYTNQQHLQHLQFLRSNFASDNNQQYLLTITVVGMTGKRISVCIDKNSSIIYDLKQLIFRETRCDTERQVLLHDGRLLSDSDMIRDTKLQNNSIIQLVTPMLHGY